MVTPKEPGFHLLESPAQMAQFAVRMQQAGAGWHAPLLRAAMSGDLRLLMVPPGRSVPLAVLDPQRDHRPLVVILCGDGVPPQGTPDDFPQARRLMRWAGFVMLHGAAGEAWHYGLAAELATVSRRVLIVETTGSDLPAWIDLKNRLAPRTPSIGWKVPDGQPQHPINAAPAEAVIQ
jgi:hypothetical protein